MEGPTYKGRERSGKREREGPPGYYGFPPGPRGASIVTAYSLVLPQLRTGWWIVHPVENKRKSLKIIVAAIQLNQL